MMLEIESITFRDPAIALKMHDTKTSSFSTDWVIEESESMEHESETMTSFRVGLNPSLIAKWRVSTRTYSIRASLAITNSGIDDVLLDWVSPFWCGHPTSGQVRWTGVDVAGLQMIHQPLWMGGGGVSDLTSRVTHPFHWASTSYWTGIITEGAQCPTMTLGIGERANTQQRVSARVLGNQLDLALESDLSTNMHRKPFRLQAGQTFHVQPVLLVHGSTRQESVARYTSLLRDQCGGGPRRTSHGGVFSGYGMSARDASPEKVSDAKFIAEVATVMRDLRAQEYGVTYFKTQFSRYSTGPKTPELSGRPRIWPEMDAADIPGHIIDHGFVPSCYDLTERAPAGVKAITDQIRACGFVPGFDSRPFLNLDSSSVIHDELVAELYERIVREWGYDYLMFDFVSTDFENSDDTRTMSQAIADRFEAVRSRVGEEVFLEACMCVPGPVLGIVDGLRPATDWRPGLEPLLASEFASRYYYHNSVVLEDMEYVDVSARPACWDAWNNRAMQSIDRVRTMISLSAITGFSTLIGGFVEEMGAERWRLFTRCLPILGNSGEPCDYPENDPPQVWTVHHDVGGSSLTVVAAFNWSENHETDIPISAFVEVPPGTVVFDFWSQKVVLPTHGTFTPRLAPSTSAVYFFTTTAVDHSGPVYVGTDRHVLGFSGLESLSWDPDGNVLVGNVRLIGDPHVSIYLYLPPSLAPDFDRVTGCTCDIQQRHALRVDVDGTHGDIVRWVVPFRTDHFVF